MVADTAKSTPRHLNFERLVFFSDAVFAIVITLLVLPLTAHAGIDEAPGNIAARVWNMWPEALSFAISFLVIGRFWLAHHRMFGLLVRYDQGLLGLNLVCLLLVSFLPFPTAVLGALPLEGDSFPAVFYAASITVTSVSFNVMWAYALRRGLVDESLDTRQLQQFTLRSAAISAMFLASVAAAFAGAAAAIICWLVAVPAASFLVSLRSRGTQRKARRQV